MTVVLKKVAILGETLSLRFPVLPCFKNKCNYISLNQEVNTFTSNRVNIKIFVCILTLFAVFAMIHLDRLSIFSDEST